MFIKELLTAKRTAAVVLTFAAMFCAVSMASAQQERIVFSNRTLTVEGALRQIEQQTPYLVSYSKSGFNLTRKVRLSHNNLTLSTALDQILSKSNRNYTIRGNHILIVPRQASPEEVRRIIAVVEENETSVAPEPYEAPDTVILPQPVDLTKPPVDVDSLEKALRERLVEYPAEIPVEPELDRSLYYNERDRDGSTPGKPAYTDHMPAYALRSNLLYAAAALSPNIGIEFGLTPRSTVLAGFGYNGWNTNGTASDNEKLCHWIVQAEYRYWLCERFNGHFIGANAFYGYYNIGGKKIPMVLEKNSDRYRYKGNLYGAGVSYGYQLMLASRWNLEFNAGVGVGRMKYDKFNCPRCGELLEKGVSRTFFAPTKLGISVVFMIK